MFERFTNRARRVLVLAQEEARLLNHNFIGTEHILLGLIREDEGIAAVALTSLGISLNTARERVQEAVGPEGHAPPGTVQTTSRAKQETVGPEGHAAPTRSVPFTPRAKKVLELSLREALQLDHNYIGTEHILLGLVGEGEGVAAQVLVSLGTDLSQVRQQVIQLLAGYQGQARASGQVTPSIPGLQSRRGPRAEPPGEPPTCPSCGASLAHEGVWSLQSIPSADQGREPRSFTVIHCRVCGTAVAVLPGDPSA